MAESPKKKTRPVRVAAVPDGGADDAARSEPNGSVPHAEGACPVALCPICAAVSLMKPLSPEVLEHLLNAGREFLLAAKAALDTLAADPADRDDGSFEKIDIG